MSTEITLNDFELLSRVDGGGAGDVEPWVPGLAWRGLKPPTPPEPGTNPNTTPRTQNLERELRTRTWNVELGTRNLQARVTSEAAADSNCS